MQIKIRNSALALLSMALTGSVFAVGSGIYVGTNFGESNLHNVTQTFQTTAAKDAANKISAKADNTGIGIRLFMGYNINKYAAFEGGFSHFASTTYSGVPTTIAFNSPSIHEYGFDAEAKGIFPMGPFGAFAKLGFAYIRKSASGSLAACNSKSASEFPCSNTSSITTGTQANALRPLAAIGASYDFSQNWVADLSYTRITKGGGIQNADFISLGISYHFVDEYCGQFLC
jgi:OOP family OmpA-OmpF porin